MVAAEACVPYQTAASLLDGAVLARAGTATSRLGLTLFAHLYQQATASTAALTVFESHPSPLRQPSNDQSAQPRKLAAAQTDANLQTPPPIKIRKESLPDLVFGLALSIGSLILVGKPTTNGTDLATNVLLFGFGFAIVVLIWLG